MGAASELVNGSSSTAYFLLMIIAGSDSPAFRWITASYYKEVGMEKIIYYLFIIYYLHDIIICVQ